MSVREVSDIGSGVVTATIAWRLLSDVKGVNFRLVDQSKHQLQLAKNFLQTDLFVDDVTKLMTVPDATTNFDALSILSYSICEMKMFGMNAGQILSRCSNQILVIDYKEVLTWFANKNRERFKRFRVLSEHYCLPANIKSVLGQDTLKVSFLDAEW